MSIVSLLLGRPLANQESAARKIGVLAGVPAMGLDGLSSSAYGPEAALTMLTPLGVAGLADIGPITLVILGVLAILYVSYRQTIAAYPSGGGSYVVAKGNLGLTAGLLAATALMIDYLLNVAVGISAGIAALVSAVPALHPYTLSLCLAALVLIALVNLRGTVESGLAFAIPTYLFLISFGGVLLFGVIQAWLNGGHPVPVEAPPAVPPATMMVSLWLLLRSFASGCTAMTGVEAVSNGVNAFRDPAVDHARRTLTLIVAALGLLLAGIIYLAQTYGIGAMDQTQPGYQSVLSQLAAAVVGRGAIYDVAIGSVLAVLILSANTSFVGFSRLCRLVAQDGFLPRAFAVSGRRLVYSVGILFLAGSAGGLLLAFGGITDRLIPLFAVGAFVAFTLSQAGMAVHWYRSVKSAAPRDRTRDQVRLLINALGAGATGAALGVILVAKFRDGAWITVVVVCAVLVLLKAVKRHYDWVARQLRECGPLDLHGLRPPLVVIPIESWTRLTDKALHFALRLSPDVVAVHLTALEGPDADDCGRALQQQWSADVEQPARLAGLRPPKLVLLRSPYRQLLEPLLDFIRHVETQHPDRPIAILIPELVKRHWWQYLLYTHRARRLRGVLLRYGESRLVVINVPWLLEEPKTRDAAPQVGMPVCAQTIP